MLGDVVVWSLDAAAMSLDDVVEVRGAQRLEGHKVGEDTLTSVHLLWLTLPRC